MDPVSGASGDAGFWRKIFDTVPLPMLIVDADLRILDFNAAATALLGPDQRIVLRRRSGEVLHCVHATAPGSEGCGRSPACKDCVIRNSVGAAFSGTQVNRQRAMLERVQDGKTRQIQLLVTTAPFASEGQSRALLLLEDVSELMALRDLLPICARCKKIRDDQRYWHRLEEYFLNHLSVTFTHSICPECIKELYPEL